MIRSFQIVNYTENKEELVRILDFFDAIGLRITNRTLGEESYVALTGPEVSFGIGLGRKEWRVLDIGLIDTESAYQIAKKKKIRIVDDFLEGSAQRAFTLEFPGGLRVVIHPVSELSGL